MFLQMHSKKRSTYLHFSFVSLLCIKPEALAWSSTTSTASSLLSWSFTNRSHQERLHSDTGIVHLFESGIGAGKEEWTSLMDKTYLKNKDGFKFVFKCSFWLGNPKLYASERKKKIGSRSLWISDRKLQIQLPRKQHLRFIHLLTSSARLPILLKCVCIFR